uniref:HECT domain-containing protein n=2 Tax=Paramoeba aestuarina TaxID=180227 RepID=A0A7S4PEY0_9EUKA|mmetsp:Transcript_4966/g.7412  ORF Transcript_4966/g.7412 Transcript_4966/m.7412 type:complete len:159 (+) Transcript_4966:24-500(+)
MNAFTYGFNRVFPMEKLKLFQIHELENLICGATDTETDAFWCISALEDSIKCDHGYSTGSKVIQNLFSVMSNFTRKQKIEFLVFVTGSPRLPIQGWKGLNPPLTIVLSNPEPPFDPSDFLPTVSTCFHYLKLPEYPNIEILETKLKLSMESKSRFHLS